MMTNPRQNVSAKALMPLPWYQLLLKAVTRVPTPRHLSELEKQYPLLAANPQQTCLYSYLWLALADVAGFLIRFALRWLLYYRATLSADILTAQWSGLVIDIGIRVARDLIYLAIIYTLLHVFARAIGQKGRYSHLVFLVALYAVPFFLVLGIVGGILPPTVRLFSISLIVILYFAYVYQQVYMFVYHVGKGMSAVILLVAALLMLLIMFIIQMSFPDSVKYLAWY